MKKKIGILLALALLMGMLSGCGNCKAEDCDLEVYESGYCELHYGLNELKDQLGGLFG